MDHLFGDIQHLIGTNPWLAFVAVFAGGTLTASNPCVLAMIPLTIAFVSGDQSLSNWRRSLVFSLFLVLGLSVTFTALGVAASLVGSRFGANSPVWKYLVVAVCLLTGLHLLEAIKIPIPRLASSPGRWKGTFGAFMLGILFGFVSTPCAAPILVVILAYLAVKGSSLAYGGALLFTYAMGHCLMILIAGTSMGAAKGILESKRITKANQILRQAAGVVIIVVGLYFLKQSL